MIIYYKLFYFIFRFHEYVDTQSAMKVFSFQDLKRNSLLGALYTTTSIKLYNADPYAIILVAKVWNFDPNMFI